MFTGIITEIGKIKSVARNRDFARLEIKCDGINKSVNVGDSISVNGVCLSVVGKDKDLVFDVVDNTFQGTNLKRLKVSSKVNLEDALKMGERLSGHIVLGHVDGERMVRDNKRGLKGWALDINIFPEDRRYLALKGSVTIDGVSLTIGELYDSYFRIYLIPHTLENTVLLSKKKGEYANIEFDIMAKYAQKAQQGGVVTKELLREKGFV